MERYKIDGTFSISVKKAGGSGPYEALVRAWLKEEHDAIFSDNWYLYKMRGIFLNQQREANTLKSFVDWVNINFENRSPTVALTDVIKNACEFESIMRLNYRLSLAPEGYQLIWFEVLRLMMPTAGTSKILQCFEKYNRDTLRTLRVVCGPVWPYAPMGTCHRFLPGSV